MFEEALFNHVKDNFSVSGYSLTFGFGDIKASAKAPYIIMWVLDSNGDPQFLCNSQFDAGDSLIQFTVYSELTTNGFAIKRELDLFLNGLTSLTHGSETYKIVSVRHEPSPSANFKDNGLAADVLAKTFNYNRG